MPDAGDRARAARIIARVISYGVRVNIMAGHENRGGTFLVVPTKVFDHHDASSRKSGEWGALGLILDGTPRGIPGPLSNAQVARCLDNIPKIAWVADGTCSHAGLGGPIEDLPLNDANRRAYGVEKANDGIGEPYTAAAMYAATALFHAMAVECGERPESFPLGHKEWTTRKSDPIYSMTEMRRRVGAFTPTGDDMGHVDSIGETALDAIKNRVWRGAFFTHPTTKKRVLFAEAVVANYLRLEAMAKGVQVDDAEVIQIAKQVVAQMDEADLPPVH